jgi:hypothetical protein
MLDAAPTPTTPPSTQKNIKFYTLHNKKSQQFNI